MKKILEVENLTVKRNDSLILRNLHFTINNGEQWAILGASGSGKTTLAHALIGKIFFSGNIRYNTVDSTGKSPVVLVEQQHHFKNLSNTSELYYQQRFNSFDAEDTITVETALAALEDKEKWMDMLHLTPLLSKPLIQLSNGENKRLQLVKALSLHPALILLDNPFTGLDAEGRKTLQTIFSTLTKEGIHLLLITSPHEIPECITHIAVLENGNIAWQGLKKEYAADAIQLKQQNSFSFTSFQLRSENTFPDFINAVTMKNVTVKYGDKIILNNINWTIRKGECWSLSGPNGAGKSTLLSLINADNPQAYANEIYLFDKRRGKGESIWDIKKKIGYVSPELHLFFEQHNTCFEVIASGLFDTIGLFRRINKEQELKVQEWIYILKLEALQHRPMFQLSASQQRMVLLARSLVKNPPLLILDEPCQGLDEEQTSFFIQLVNTICLQLHTTLVFVSHYKADIPQCVTKFMELEGGNTNPKPK